MIAFAATPTVLLLLVLPGTQFFEVKKDKPLSRLLETAKDIMREALPIKCLEAVIVFILLTMELESLDRFPISFKSAFHGQQHRHIVLGVRHAGRYGALGLSRRDTLMFKPLTFPSLAALISDYSQSYAAVGHALVRVRIGRAVPHDPLSSATVDWRALVVHPAHFTPNELSRVLDRFGRGIRAGTLPSEAVVLRHPERPNLGLSQTNRLNPASTLPRTPSAHAAGPDGTSASAVGTPLSLGATLTSAATASFSLSGTFALSSPSGEGTSRATSARSVAGKQEVVQTAAMVVAAEAGREGGEEGTEADSLKGDEPLEPPVYHPHPPAAPRPRTGAARPTPREPTVAPPPPPPMFCGHV
jgi:hypothetical protein